MKLTEAKLKQMILETMQRSSIYNKLKTLLTTEEGYLQADSLFEMDKDQLDPKEQLFMENYLKPIKIGKELKQLLSQVKEARTIWQDSIDKNNDLDVFDLQSTELAEKNGEDLKLISSSYKRKKKELDNLLRGMEPEISKIARTIATKYSKGQL